MIPSATGRGGRVFDTYVCLEQGFDVLELHLRVDLNGVELALVRENGDAHVGGETAGGSWWEWVYECTVP